MSILDTVDKRNSVILNRNESKVSDKFRQDRYRIKFKDGSACTMLDPNLSGYESVARRMAAKFGDRFDSVEVIS